MSSRYLHPLACELRSRDRRRARSRGPRRRGGDAARPLWLPPRRQSIKMTNEAGFRGPPNARRFPPAELSRDDAGERPLSPRSRRSGQSTTCDRRPTRIDPFPSFRSPPIARHKRSFRIHPSRLTAILLQLLANRLFESESSIVRRRGNGLVESYSLSLANTNPWANRRVRLGGTRTIGAWLRQPARNAQQRQQHQKHQRDAAESARRSPQEVPAAQPHDCSQHRQSRRQQLIATLALQVLRATGRIASSGRVGRNTRRPRRAARVDWHPRRSGTLQPEDRPSRLPRYRLQKQRPPPAPTAACRVP
jgi:hypothetical protein